MHSDTVAAFLGNWHLTLPSAFSDMRGLYRRDRGVLGFGFALKHLLAAESASPAPAEAAARAVCDILLDKESLAELPAEKKEDECAEEDCKPNERSEGDEGVDLIKCDLSEDVRRADRVNLIGRVIGVSKIELGWRGEGDVQL